MLNFIDFAAVSIFTALLAGGLAWLIGRARPKNLAEHSGAITPEKWSAFVTVLFGTAMLVGGIIGLAAHSWAVGGGLCLLGAALAGFMLPSLTTIHEVRWNRDFVEGPSRTFGPTLGIERTRIGWNEILETGHTGTDYWFIATPDGRRIYWSYLYKGYMAFVSYLRVRRPDIDLPSDGRL